MNVLPWPGRAREPDLAAQQRGELPADRETEAGAAVLPARARVGLLKRLEDQPLLLGSDPDAGVADFDGDAARHEAEDGMVRRPARRDRLHAHRHLALRGELERVREQVLENLLQPLRVARERPRQGVVDVELEAQVLRLRDVVERPEDRFAERGEGDLLRLDGDGARLDLRQVEDVVDQRQQVGAGRMDVPGEVHLLGGEVAAAVLGELLPEDQNRVERRPQLVRHVRQEFRLVLRGQRELGRLLFERAPRLLDFLVLALDFDVLFGELLRLRGQLLVGLLQLGLPRLQLHRQLLRLLQQVLGPHRRLDGVQHDADRLRELLEERQMGGRERLQRRELDDGLRFALRRAPGARRCSWGRRRRGSNGPSCSSGAPS